MCPCPHAARPHSAAAQRPHALRCRRRPSPARILVVALLGANVSCHAYRPAALADLGTGDEVRARLTLDQYEELGELLLGGDRLMEGTVIDAAPDSILMEVPVVTVAEGIRLQSYSQRIRVPLAGITEMELRTLDRGRTWGLVGLVGAVGGGLIWYELGRRSRRSGPTPPTPPEEGPPRLVFLVPLRLP